MKFADIVSRLSPLTKDQLILVAKRSGVPFHTLRKIATGETANPMHSTVEKLQHYYAKS